MSGISLEILKSNDCGPEVEDFIRSSVNGTIFHSPRFLSYHGEDKFRSQGGEIRHLLFREKSRIAAFMPAMLLSTESREVLKSPYGGSYGGFVHAGLSFDEAQEIMDRSLQYFRQSGIQRIEVVPSPPLYSRDDSLEYFTYLLLKSGFTISKADLLIVCGLSRDRDYPAKALKKNARKFQAQALRNGITVRESDDLETFYEILLANRAKHHILPTHSLEELVRIKSLFPEEVLLYLAHAGERPVAGALLFVCNWRVVNCFYLCHVEEFADQRPNNLLIPEILAGLAGRGYDWLDFGPSSFGYAPHESLIRYKESFGGKGMCRYYYQLGF